MNINGKAGVRGTRGDTTEERREKREERRGKREERREKGEERGEKRDTGAYVVCWG